MDSTKLREINALQADRDLEAVRHQEEIAHADNIAQTVLSATSTLIQYLEGHTTKAEVVNQLESIATPDVKYVVEALQVLDRTIQDRPTTDLSQVTALMSELVNEAKLLPKQLPDTPEIPTPIDYTKQLSSLKDAITAVEKVVKAQKLVAEAPVVNVPETNVHVDAPDLKPITSATEKLEKTVKLGQEEQAQAANKTASGLITERFDEYKIVYTVPFDDEKPVVSATKYYLAGKVVATVKYSYNKAGDLTGAKKT